MAGASVSPELQLELEEIARAQGCELVHLEFRGGTMRLVLDREGGVRLEECEAVSKAASALLDVAEFGRGRYTLEVSSPGLDRPLYRPSDYARFVGRRVRVRFRDPETGKRATVVGKLAQYRDEGGGWIELTETESKRDLTIRLEQIELTRLTIEL